MLSNPFNEHRSYKLLPNQTSRIKSDKLKERLEEELDLKSKKEFLRGQIQEIPASVISQLHAKPDFKESSSLTIQEIDSNHQKKDWKYNHAQPVSYFDPVSDQQGLGGFASAVGASLKSLANPDKLTPGTELNQAQKEKRYFDKINFAKGAEVAYAGLLQDYLTVAAALGELSSMHLINKFSKEKKTRVTKSLIF